MFVIPISQFPNRKYLNDAPANTNWHKLAIPNGVPVGTIGVSVIMKSRAASGVADGSPFLVQWDQSTAPSDGFMVSGNGQAFALTLNNNVWVQLTASTDTLNCLFYW